MKRFLNLALSAMFLVGLFACSPEPVIHHTKPTVQKSTQTKKVVASESFLMNADDLDVPGAMDIFKGRLKEINIQKSDEVQTLIVDLAKAINNEASGINEVDLDGDGNFDPIKIVEVDENGEPVVASPDGQPKARNSLNLNLVAVPTDESLSTTVAQLSFSKSTTSESVEFSGAYTESVSGYQDNYYHENLGYDHYPSARYFFRPRPYYMSPYHHGFYPTRVVVVREVRQQRRQEYRKSNNMTPTPTVKKAPRPATKKIRSAKVKKSEKAGAKKLNNLSGNKDRVNKFTERDAKKKKNTSSLKAPSAVKTNSTAKKSSALKPKSAVKKPTSKTRSTVTPRAKKKASSGSMFGSSNSNSGKSKAPSPPRSRSRGRRR